MNKTKNRTLATAFIAILIIAVCIVRCSGQTDTLIKVYTAKHTEQDIQKCFDSFKRVVWDTYRHFDKNDTAWIRPILSFITDSAVLVSPLFTPQDTEQGSYYYFCPVFNDEIDRISGWTGAYNYYSWSANTLFYIPECTAISQNLNLSRAIGCGAAAYFRSVYGYDILDGTEEDELHSRAEAWELEIATMIVLEEHRYWDTLMTGALLIRDFILDGNDPGDALMAQEEFSFMQWPARQEAVSAKEREILKEIHYIAMYFVALYNVYPEKDSRNQAEVRFLKKFFENK